MPRLTIGQVAARADVGVETIRFYERRGLIAEPPRDPSSGYRKYAPSVIRRLQFIRRAKDLGFTLDEIAELLALRVDPNGRCADVRGRAREKITAIEARIRELEQMRAALGRLEARCTCDGPVTECSILEELYEGDDDAC